MNHSRGGDWWAWMAMEGGSKGVYMFWGSGREEA